jgi:hypothetical protein
LGGPHSYGSDFAFGEFRANPFLIDALEPIGRVIQQDVSGPILVICGFGPIFVAIYRYTRSATIESKQIRWLLFGYVITTVGYVTPVMFSTSNQVVMAVSAALALDSFVFPITIGVGILFYGLWDIDVLIRRTFTYSLISVILVGSYLLIVLASQAVLHTFIESESSLTVVISTLGVAVLFNPVRERVQRFIDRLFNRKHYDADATLESFRDNIRDAIEPEAIQGHLVQTISSTIQPVTISLWSIDKS